MGSGDIANNPGVGEDIGIGKSVKLNMDGELLSRTKFLQASGMKKMDW